MAQWKTMRHLSNEIHKSTYSFTCIRSPWAKSMSTRIRSHFQSGDLGWTLAYFSGRKIFSQWISRTLFCPIVTKFGSVRGLANRKLLPEFCELWSGGPLMQRRAPVLHWCICKVVYRQLLHVCRQFWCCFCSPHCPSIWCKLSVQVPCIAHSRGRPVVPCDRTAFLLLIRSGTVISQRQWRYYKSLLFNMVCTSVCQTSIELSV